MEKVSSPCDSILIAIPLACYVNKELTACNSVDGNRLNERKADNTGADPGKMKGGG